MRRLVLGTAGHIDHGKTALVQALTGTDTDRLPEERRRGITIDLGFARLPLSDDLELAIVDVPGHEAFIRNMVAGATGVDLVMLVVAADEGVMPQTREHLAILDLLGVRAGVIVITKADLADPEWLELVCDDVGDLVRGTALDDAPLLATSVRTGAGIDELRRVLADAAGRTTDRTRDDLFRMPLDRVFTVRGTGTVVTGTVWSGSLRQDERVRIEPAGLTARVRGLHQHDVAVEQVVAGSRAAVALSGIDRTALTRGDTLLTGDGWATSGMLTVEIHVTRDAAAALRPRQRVHVHLGTAEVAARLGMMQRPLEPGDSGILQLRLERPIVARAGDRVVLRSWSPVITIAGGSVLEPRPPRRRRLPATGETTLRRLLEPDSAIHAAVELAGPAGLPLHDLPVLTGLAPRHVERVLADSADLLTLDGRVLESTGLAAAEATILDALRTFHSRAPLLDGIEKEQLRQAITPRLAPLFEPAAARLLRSGAIRTAGNSFALTGHVPAPDAAQHALLDEIAALFARAALQPPTLDELPPSIAARQDLLPMIRYLERDRRLVRLGPDRWCDATALDRAIAALRASLQPGEAHEVGRYREVLGASRKHLIPLLEFLDHAGVTVRMGERRAIRPPTTAAT
jgi:selenocysteine-specific elongation factor